MNIQRIFVFGIIMLLLPGCDLFKTVAPFAQHVTFQYTVMDFNLAEYREHYQRLLAQNDAAIASGELNEIDRLPEMNDAQLEEDWRLKSLQKMGRVLNGTTQITDEFRFPLCEAFVQDPNDINFEVPSPGTAPQLGGVTLFASCLSSRDTNPPVTAPQPCNAPIRPSSISIVGAGEILGQPSAASTISITMNNEYWTVAGLYNRFEVSTYTDETQVGTGAFSFFALNQGSNWQNNFTRFIAVTEGTFIAQE